MAPTKTAIDDIRALHAEGHTVVAIAETYGLSRRYVQEICADPPTAEELEAVAEARRQRERARYADTPRFAGFEGQDAVEAAELFGAEATGGNAWGPGSETR